LNNQNS